MPEGLIASLCNHSLYNSWHAQLELNSLEFLKILQKDILKTNTIFLFLIKICITIKKVLNVCFGVRCY